MTKDGQINWKKIQNYCKKIIKNLNKDEIRSMIKALEDK